MTNKANHLHNKLKMYMPEEEIGVDIPLMDDNEKKIKRLENLLRIKNEEVLFKLQICWQSSRLIRLISTESTIWKVRMTSSSF